MDQSEIGEMIDGYLEAALFTADEEIIKPQSGEFPSAEYMPRVSARMRELAGASCRAFYAANAADLAEYPAREAGHDLWYTSNGHGVGFWEADHCAEPEGERLSRAAKRVPERSVFVGDNGTFDFV